MKVWILTRSYWENPCKDFKGVWLNYPSAEELTKVCLNTYVASKIYKDGKYTDSINDQFWYLEEKDAV